MAMRAYSTDHHQQSLHNPTPTRYGMSHEHDPSDPFRNGTGHHVPDPQGPGSGPSGQPAWADPDNTSLQPRRWQDPGADQQPLPGLENLPVGPPDAYMFQGPVPPPGIIKQYDDLSPGMGQRIMDDAHEDIVQDRQITREAFDYAIKESKIRVRLAVGITVCSFLGIFVSLAAFDDPESIIGATLCGLGAAGPTIRALLNRGDKKDDQDQNAPPPPAQ